MMVWATSGTLSHFYSAILIIGDYRTPPDDTPPSNVTTTVPTTSPTDGLANSQLSPGSGLTPAVGVLWSLQSSPLQTFALPPLTSPLSLRPGEPSHLPLRPPPGGLASIVVVAARTKVEALQPKYLLSTPATGNWTKRSVATVAS